MTNIINQISNNIIDQFLKSIKNIAMSLPELDFIYHYTSQSVYLSIIKSKELWLSHISNLNDPRELTFGLEVLKEYFKIKITNNNSIVLKWMNEIDPYNPREMKNVFYEPIFLISFSEEPDDMSQWISYGDNGCGTSISFLPREIIPTLTELSLIPVLMPVSYFPENWNFRKTDNLEYLNIITNFMMEIDKIAFSINNSYSQDDTGYLHNLKREFIEYLYMFASYIKHDFYKQEKEWRLFINTGIGNPNISIEPDGDKVKTIYKILLKEPKSEKNPYPEKDPKYINKIHKHTIIGPRHKNNEQIKTALEIAVHQELGIGPGSTIQFSNGIIR